MARFKLAIGIRMVGLLEAFNNGVARLVVAGALSFNVIT